jgi:hypothetical protein
LPAGGDDIIEQAAGNIAGRKMSNCAIINEAIFVGLKKALEGGKLQIMHLVNVNSSHIAWQSLASGMAKSQSL